MDDFGTGFSSLSLAHAEAAFEGAARCDPTYAPSWINLADLYRATGRDAQAEALLRRATQAAPDDPDAHYALALWLARHKRYLDARAEADRAARLRPDEKRYSNLLHLLP